jgi:multidrug efflux pump subunit AcrA (membrane-fusion protein)
VISSAGEPATVEQNRVQVEQDVIAVTNALKTLRATTVRAPISGTVTEVNGAVGDTVGASSGSSLSASSSSGASGSSSSGGNATGATGSSSSPSSSGSSSSLVTIENMRKLRVVAGFPEADAIKIKVGQSASVTLSALSNVQMTGTVSAVAPTPTVASNVVTYDVTISLHNPPATVKTGMTAEVTVYVSRRTNVLLVPSAAITSTGPVSTVTVLENGKQRVVTVSTGLVGASTTQILSGLREGQTVIEPTVTVGAAPSTNTPTANRTFGGGPGGGFGGPPGR